MRVQLYAQIADQKVKYTYRENEGQLSEFKLIHIVRFLDI